jgi:subtilisin family serine protease
MSLSTTAEYFKTHPEQLTQYEAAIKKAVGAGIAIIVAAGNTGKEQILYPAWFEDVITVGAVDAERKTAFFTTRSKQVDVCQNGTDILSAYLDGKSYQISSGTSKAAPHVAGIAALIISKYKALFGKYMPEPAIYETLKINTIDMDIAGVDIATGAGYCTLNPTQSKIKIEMTADNTTIMVNGKPVESDAAPTIAPPGRFMAPVRFLVENIGGQASYDTKTKKATFEVEL